MRSLNINYLSFKTVMEYLYLEDLSFINNIEGNTSLTLIDILSEFLKLAKLLELKSLQAEIESKIRFNLYKYYEAINNINMSFTGIIA